MLWQPVGSEAAWSGCDTILDPGLLLRPAMNNSELLQALKLKMKELSEASPYIHIDYNQLFTLPVTFSNFDNGMCLHLDELQLNQ